MSTEPVPPPDGNPSLATLIRSTADNAGMGFSELMAAEFGPPVYVLSNFLHEGHVAVFGGAFGQGKTFLWLQISIHAAVGRPVLGMNVTRPYRVLFLDTENGKAEIKNRLQRYVPDMALSPPEHALLNENWKYIDFQDDGPLNLLDLAKPDGFVSLSNYLRKHHAAELIVLDCFGKVFSGKEGDEDRIKELCSRCSGLVRSHTDLQSGAVVFLHHFTKMSELSAGFDLMDRPTEYLSRMRGSGRLMDLVQGRYGMCEVKTEEETYTIVNGVSRSCAILPMLLQRQDTGFFALHQDSNLVEQKTFGKAKRQLEIFVAIKTRFSGGEPFTYSDVIAIRSGWATQTVSDCLSKAVGARLLDQLPAKRGYRLPPQARVPSVIQ
jgi:AAA domain